MDVCHLRPLLNASNIVVCMTLMPVLHVPQNPLLVKKDDSNTHRIYPIFENLLGVPWDEYLQMDDELEAENPCCAPDANTYTENVQNFPDQDQRELKPMPTAEEILNL